MNDTNMNDSTELKEARDIEPTYTPKYPNVAPNESTWDKEARDVDFRDLTPQEVEARDRLVALDRRIEQWRNKKKNSRYTRAIVKIINYTSHTFKIAQTSLPLGKTVRESLQLLPRGQTAYKSEFDYNYDYPWPKNKIMFNQTTDFTDQNVGVRFDLGLIMSTSFGYITPTLRPSIKNTVTSIGKSKINCSTKITYRSDEEPFNFEVEITLG
jgi:hypothetical protein